MIRRLIQRQRLAWQLLREHEAEHAEPRMSYDEAVKWLMTAEFKPWSPADAAKRWREATLKQADKYK